ncbi:MAG: ricin-type beta-trefoil lectin domain protein [Pseudomonadota bacterium]
MNATMKTSLTFFLLMSAAALAAYTPTASAQVAPLIKNTGNSRCLAANTMGAVVTQACGGAAIYSQRWTQVNTGSGFLIKNIGTQSCLNNHATGKVFMSPCNPATASQRWLRQNFSPLTARYRSIGTGLFLNSTSAGGVLSGPFMASPLQVWAY